ncbi:UvrB/UvrC motif-containing protein [Candidatus Falkowbacteria bacterium]|nr:UvrB/UvrC motif-containing protein [Candidatus Falkowbacteria bacterium]
MRRSFSEGGDFEKAIEIRDEIRKLQK